MPTNVINPQQCQGKITKDTILQAGIVLGRAFAGDPSMLYATKSVTSITQRDKIISTICVDMVRYASSYAQLDLAYDDKGNVSGVAIWLLPGCHISTFKMILSGCWRWPATVGLEVIKASLAYSNIVEEYHEKNAPNNHHYLYMLGVSPDQQNKGVGSQLLNMALQRVGTTDCYLETFSERSIPFYLRHGFTILSFANTPDHTGPRFWMLKK